MRYIKKIFRPLLVVALGTLTLAACDDDVTANGSANPGVLGDQVVTQSDRFGLPAVTTVFIAGSVDKDTFNLAAPANDESDFLAILSQTIQARYGCNATTADALAGFFLADVQPLGGVLGGAALSGFPNGRRLEDDVVDVALSLIFGSLGQSLGFACALVPALDHDGVDANDVPFLSQFPYLAAPHTL